MNMKLIRTFVIGSLIGVLLAGALASQADCDGTTGDDTIVCSADPNVPDQQVDGDLGNDTITVDAGVTVTFIDADGEISGVDNPGAGNGGNDVIVNDGTVTVAISGDYVTGAAGNDTITNNGTAGSILADDVATTSGNDIITNNGTVVTNIVADNTSLTPGNDSVTNNGQVGGNITTGGGTDSVTVGSTGDVVGNIDAGDGNDAVTMNDGAMVGGIVDGGAGTDTLTFQFNDPAEGAAAALALAALSPAGGTITFGGQTYTWINFEQLRALYTIAVQSGATDIKINIARINDSRLNAYDLGAPVAIYCVPGEHIEVIDIGGDGVNTVAFRASMSDVNAAVSNAQSTFATVFIAGDLGDMLVAKQDGSLVVLGPTFNGEKMYNFTFQPQCNVTSIGLES